MIDLGPTWEKYSRNFDIYNPHWQQVPSLELVPELVQLLQRLGDIAH